MLRLANIEEIDVLTELANDFFQHSPYKYSTFDTQGVKNSFKGIIEANGELGIVLVATDDKNQPVGFLVALLSHVPWNGWKVATELGWWMSPQHRGKDGIKLYEAFEYWSKYIAKADVIQSGLIHEKTSKFYNKRGYSKHEESWIKKI